MFYKKYLSLNRCKVSFFVLPLLIASIIFIIYQISIFMQISNEYKTSKLHFTSIRGTHEQQAAFYKPNAQNKFVCIRSLEEIDFKLVNDDYCDCLDGSDEPGTNACSNGIFYCRNQKHFPKSVPSSMVNDGICDCCDGSDEWKNHELLHNFNKQLQKRTHKSHQSCPNIC